MSDKLDDHQVTLAALWRMEEILDVHTISGNFDIVAELRTSSLKRLDRDLCDANGCGNSEPHQIGSGTQITILANSNVTMTM